MLVKKSFIFLLPIIQLGRSLLYTEKWGYVDVREDASMFWWLYQMDDPSNDRPLIIWLQGGPGDSSTGYGNFQEIGPLDATLNARNNSWLTRADLLFIDSPVGSGFSYASTPEAFTTSLKEIIDDLMNFTYVWIGNNRQYQDRASFVFGESFGGKVAVAYASEVDKHIKSRTLRMNLKGVGLGNSWISPSDFVLSWPDFLYYHSWLSPRGLEETRRKTEKCHNYTKFGQWINATECMQNFAKFISKITAGVSWYNVLKHDKSDAYSKKLLSGDDSSNLGLLMNGPVRQKLRIIPDHVQWGAQADTVYLALYDEIMRPVVDVVDHLLEDTDLYVFIYNGQLDLICNTPAVQTWLKRLTWSKMGRYYSANRQYLSPKEPSEDWSRDQDLFLQRHDRLWFFWVLHAGHNVGHMVTFYAHGVETDSDLQVPADAAEASLKMLDTIFEETVRRRR